MRAMFSLVSLLIFALIIAYLWATHTAAISKPARQAKEEVTQLSGHDENGKPALESIKTDAGLDAGGHLKSLVVTDVVPDGAMDKFYGFKKGDRITNEGQYDVTTNGDAEMARAMLLDAYEKHQSVEVIRDGQQIELPLGGTAGKTTQDQFNQLQHIGGQ